jgi:WD40-like Beta Propeller Repeat
MPRFGPNPFGEKTEPMRRNLLPIFAVASTIFLIGGCLHAPMPWSPDGKWLAYTVEVRPIERILQPGWLLESPTVPSTVTTAPGPPTAYRLWATRRDTGASVLLEESSLPLTAPGWSPNGRALAFGRVVAESDGTGRFEVVILDGTNRRRVISSRPLPEISAEASRLPGQAIVWSPDGRHLAVPQLSPLGMAIIRADTGRQVSAVNDAFLPSWSPDSTRLAFFIRGTGDTLNCIDSPNGTPRMLAEVGQASQAPAWTRDSLTVVVVARKALPRGAEPPGDLAELIKVRVDNGQFTTLRTLAGEGVIGRDRSIQGVSIAMDAEGENLFCSMVVEGTPRQIIWFKPKDDAVHDRIPILDLTTPMGSLSLSPDGQTLAVRIGSVDRITAPALCDVERRDRRIRLIAPDDASRIEWIATLVASARSILAMLPSVSPEPKSPPNNPLDRPSLLPIAGEFEFNADPMTYLRRIGRAGRPLCDRPPGSPPADPKVTALLNEARLFFDYLSENYSAALTSLEALEEQVQTPDQRVRLLAIRAQIFIAQGKVESAEHTISYLRELPRKPGRMIEWNGSGYVVSAPEQVSGQGWLDYLAWRAATVKSLLHDDGPEFHVNPDNPKARFGFEPGDPRFNLIFPDRPFLNDPGQPPAPGDPGNSVPRPRMPREVPR